MYKELLSEALAAANWSWDLLPQPVYLVGGAVRDALLGRKREYLDLDFVVAKDAVEVARKIAKTYQAGFVLLDAERQIARVVFPGSTADFAQQEGDDLYTDLQRRDFTINAIAYNPHTQEIIDPLNGCVDLDQKIMRMISPQNLADDPLRLLRGYRQAAQLGFSVEEKTLVAIRTLAPRLSEVATERSRVELGYMLANAEGTPWLQSAGEDGLLKDLFPSANRESWAKLSVVDDAAAELAAMYPGIDSYLQAYLRDTLKTTWLAIAKIACLVNPQPEIAETELQNLTYSRMEIKAVISALKLFPRLQAPLLSLREQYFLFQESGATFLSTVVLAMAYRQPVEAIAPLICRYLNPNDLVAHTTPLLSGKELMIALNIAPSPLVGKLLTEIAIAQIEGKISTIQEAIAFAQEFLTGGMSE